MFAVIQYPFVDLRMLYGERPGGSFFPQNFPRQAEQSRYFRFLGAEKTRRDSQELPAGEQRFFQSRSGVGFLPAPGAPFSKGVFRRLYADGLSLHYDVGLYGPGSKWGRRVLRDLLDTPRLRVSGRFEPGGTAFSFYTFSNELLRLYQYATTLKKAAGPLPRPVQAGIVPGIPAVILASRDASKPSAPGVRWLQLLPGLKAGCGQYELHGHPIAVWYIHHSGFPARSDEVRRLRVCVTKIHAYKETLRLLLEFMERGSLDGVSLDVLYKELFHLRLLMEKERYYGFDNRDFWGLAYSIDEQILKGQWIELGDRVRSALNQLDRKMEERKTMTIEQHFGDVHGAVITGSTLTNSSVTVTNTAGVQDTVVQEFSSEAMRLLEEAAAGGREVSELREQVKAFCASAREDKPNKGVCKALFSGIKTAMLAVASHAEALEKLTALGEKIIGAL